MSFMVLKWTNPLTLFTDFHDFESLRVSFIFERGEVGVKIEFQFCHSEWLKVQFCIDLKDLAVHHIFKSSWWFLVYWVDNLFVPNILLWFYRWNFENFDFKRIENDWWLLKLHLIEQNQSSHIIKREPLLLVW